MANVMKALTCRFGFNPLKYMAGTRVLWRPPDFTDKSWALMQRVSRYTMTSPERVTALVEAVHHIVKYNLPGSIVECGVWKGGSMMAAALTLLNLNAADRHLYLFDTFDGMPTPSSSDVDLKGREGTSMFRKLQTGPDSSDFCLATLEEVKSAMYSTGYEPEKIHLVKGRVEETVPLHAPDQICLLRLDTDWYESTKHELHHLFPRLCKNGVLIIDDYGHWRGARKAVDEYIAEYTSPIFLSRADYSCRIAVKVD